MLPWWLMIAALWIYTKHHHHFIDAAAGEPLKVVFIGKYRSGSSSLAAALRRLGYNPCHGRDVIYKSSGSNAPLANALIRGNVSEILKATSDLGCNATLEMHSIFWKEIVNVASNDTKYIIVIRPFDAWSKSVTSLFKEVLPIHRYPLRWLPRMKKASELLASLAQHEAGYESREQALEIIRHPGSQAFQEGLKMLYDAFVHDAHDLLQGKPTQTLLFHLQDGYPPLCKFLDVVDCPTERFPHINKTRDIQVELFWKRVKEIFFYATFLICCLAPMILAWRRSRLGGCKKTKAS